MRRILILISAITLLLIAIVPAAAAGGDADCTDFPLEEFPPGEGPGFPIHLVIDEVIDGNLDVPPGVGCVVIGTTVNGDVTVEEGAVFTEIVEGSTVNGNVDIGGGAGAFIGGSSVNGNVDIGEDAGSFFWGSTVNGNVFVGEGAESELRESHVSGDFICDHCFFEDVFESTVEGNVQITGEEDGSWFIDSTIGGNLQIEDSGVMGVAFWAERTTVHGNLEMKNNKGPIYLFDNNVGGNVSIVDNTLEPSFFFPGPIPVFEDPVTGDEFVIFPWVMRDTTEMAEILGNTVGGNVEFKDNRGGRALIADNLIEGNLTCAGNEGIPTGSGNSADHLEGQCSNL